MWIWRSEDDSPRQVNASPGKGRGLSTAPGLSSGDTGSPGKGGGSGGGGGGGTGYLIETLGTVENAGLLNDHNGWDFQAQEAFSLVGLRLYARESGNSETLRLWDLATETVLDSVIVESVGFTWVEGLFSAPVALTAGANYAMTTHIAGNGNRDVARGEAADMVFSEKITYLKGRYGEGPGLPTSTAAPEYLLLWGIIDGIY